MIDQLSPSYRKTFALTLLAVATLTVCNLLIVPFFSALHDALSQLANLRGNLARAQLIAGATDAPSFIPLSPQRYIVAANRKIASGMFVAILKRTAGDRNVEISTISVQNSGAGAPSLISMDFTFSGEPSAILAFIASLEQDSPVMRFRRLNLQVERASSPGTSSDNQFTTSIMPQSPNAGSSSGSIVGSSGSAASANSTAESEGSAAERLRGSATIVALLGSVH